MQRLGIVVETVRRGVGRQQIGQIDLHAEQIAHGVRILGTIQPSHHHAAIACLCGRLPDPRSQSLHLRGWRTRLVLRRHLTSLDLLHHAQPMPSRVCICESRLQRLQIETTLWLFPGVTFAAVLIQELFVSSQVFVRTQQSARDGDKTDEVNRGLHAEWQSLAGIFLGRKIGGRVLE